MNILMRDEENILHEIVKQEQEPEEVLESPFLEIFKAQMHATLSNLGDTAPSRKSDWTISRGPFKPELTNSSKYLVGRSQNVIKGRQESYHTASRVRLSSARRNTQRRLGKEARNGV